MNRPTESLLGYINFSSGAHDPASFRALNEVFAQLVESGQANSRPIPEIPPADATGAGSAGSKTPESGSPTSAVPDAKAPDSAVPDSVLSETGSSRVDAANQDCTAYRVGRLLRAELAELHAQQGAFADIRQAEVVLSLCFDHILPGWKQWHPDLLFHQPEEFLFNPFFVGRVFEQILRSEPLEHPAEELVPRLVKRLCDYLGHRPVATLEGRRMEPYPQEYIRPVPLYIRDCGVAFGRYHEIVTGAIAILRDCDEDVARKAQLDIERLQELAIDPRALDFDHPVNRRPNHHFGQWDEQTVDSDGYFSRFIIHQITIDSMLTRVEQESELPRDELMYEASAVLACTMLMGSGISGRGPGAWDSTMTLGQLVPQIAAYRDQFYQTLLRKMPAAHRDRLLAEAKLRHQPFGAARQHINHQLGAHRDRQLVHSRVATLYARMGYESAALTQADSVQVAATRINTRLDCLLSTAAVALRNQKLDTAVGILPRLFSLIRRGIECGALPDPWTILGFDGNFSLFPATENTVRDHRVDDLVELMNQVFQLCSQLWADTAAADRKELAEKVRDFFRELAQWWRKFAAHEVMSVDGADPDDLYEASRVVAEALNLWHRGGAAAGDIEFWAQHARLFDSPNAYALVIAALLERRDFNTSRALLVHWLSQSDRIELDSGDHSFHDLLWQWLSLQKGPAADEDPAVALETWVRIGKLHDYLEANADEYWEVPDFQPEYTIVETSGGDDEEWEPNSGEELPFEEPEEDSQSGVLGAAYEDVIYNDQTDDGIEGNIHDGGGIDDADMEAEVLRVNDRLDFISSLAGFWRIAATFRLPASADPGIREPDGLQRQVVEKRRELYRQWMNQALVNRSKLAALLDTVQGYALSSAGTDTEAMQYYDRQRLMKESLVQQIIAANVEVENAIRVLSAAIAAISFSLDRTGIDEVDPRLRQWQPVIAVFAAVLLRNARWIVDLFPDLNESLQQQTLLYVPLSRGGHPRDIVRFRSTQSAIRELLACLPGLGLFVETYELTETAMTMERNTTVEQGAVTEFDEVYRVAYCAMVEAVILASRTRSNGRKSSGTSSRRDRRLLRCLEDLTESMWILWREHSRTLRLSVLERVSDRTSWQALVSFIRTYGDDLFTQEFLNLSNIRAILHQGVDQWLYRLQGTDQAEEIRLLRDIGNVIPFRQAVNYLTLVLEAVIENYSRYRDYNATTTQSDQGGLLYILLDFLRLERRYDSLGWIFKPVVWAHQMLVRKDETKVAEDWRRSLSERVGPETDRFLDMLQKLREKYSVQMVSIGQHMEGRLVQPMLIDRLVTLVGKAMKSPGSPESADAFAMLQAECQRFMDNSPGVGVDLSGWLAAMTEEVDNQQLLARYPDAATDEYLLADPLPLDLERLTEQIEMFPRRSLEKPADPEVQE